MNKATPLGVAALIAVLLAACEEETPTGVSPQLAPVSLRTLEFRLAWEDFGVGLEVFGGYGTPSELRAGLLANDFEGVLDARTLIRYENLRQLASVRDTTGTLVGDSAFAFEKGRLGLVFDPHASTNDGLVTVSVHRITEPWHTGSATWLSAVDTIGELVPWEEPGGGAVEFISEAVWDPAEGDSLFLSVDSATLEALADLEGGNHGLRLDVESEGVRLDLSNVALDFDVNPSVNPDTVLTLTADALEVTVLYTPPVDPPEDGVRVGGVPAWRSFFEIDLPRVLEGPPELCAVLGCPFELEADRISRASLILSPRPSEPAFQPTDTVLLDVRPVLAPEKLPKSPLGETLIGPGGQIVPPFAFGVESSSEVALPITSFVRGLIDPETDEGERGRGSLALLAAFEPFSVSFASFWGPGTPRAPSLRLLVTVADPVELP